jgi:hypothetical protein
MAGKKTNVSHKRWTRRENDLLKRLYPLIHTQVLAEMLHTTELNVRQKAFRLGIKKDWKGGYHSPPKRPVEKPYTKREIKQLRKMFTVLTTREISRKLTRGQWSLSAKFKELGLGRKPKPGAWSGKEIEQLKKLYAGKSAVEIAAKLGRSVYAVGMKIRKLGLPHLFVYRSKVRRRS